MANKENKTHNKSASRGLRFCKDLLLASLVFLLLKLLPYKGWQTIVFGCVILCGASI